MASRDSDGGSRLVVAVAVVLVVLGGTLPVVAQQTGTETDGTATGGTTPTGSGTATDGSTAGGTATPSGIVVDEGGGGDFTNISAAVAAAAPGDTIRIQSGTYEETVTLSKSVTLVAPEGAVLDGRNLDTPNAGITITGGADPTIRGLTLVGFQVGIDAAGTSGAWTVENVAITDSRRIGIHAAGSTGAWVVRRTTISGTTGIAVGAFRSSGDWRLERVTITDTAGVAVNARHASGAWQVQATRINGTTAGSTLSVPWSGTAVYAGNTDGGWRIQGSSFGDNAAPVIDASGASPAGDATGNYWHGNGTGPADGDCVGGVDCSGPLPVEPGGIGDPTGGGESPGGGGLPLVEIAVGVVVLIVLVGGGFFLVESLDTGQLPAGLDTDALVYRVEVLIAQALAAVGVIDNPKGGRPTDGRGLIKLENVDSETVTCRVVCRTEAGVQFQYDLTLKSGESRQARELPDNGPFEVVVRVGDTTANHQFEGPADASVRVVSDDAEVAPA
ncbi:MAG: hypothetical protein ABEH80_01410 [Halobaculum sp.]